MCVGAFTYPFFILRLPRFQSWTLCMHLDSPWCSPPPALADAFVGVGGQDASVGVRAASDVGQSHGIGDTTVDPSDQSRTQIDMAAMMHEEHGEEMTPTLSPEQLAQELQDCLSAGNLPTRTPLAQRFTDMIKASSEMMDEYGSMEGPGSTARKAAFRLKCRVATGQRRDLRGNQEGSLGRGIR